MVLILLVFRPSPQLLLEAMPILFRNALLALLVAIAAGSAVAATPEHVPLAHGTTNRNEARITFEWPEPVPFSVKANGTELQVTFGRRSNPNMGQVLSRLYPFVKSAQLRPGGKVLKLTLDEPYKIRTFQADNVQGIELIDIDPAKRPDHLLMQSPGLLSPSAGESSAATTTATASNTSALPTGAFSPSTAETKSAPAETASTTATKAAGAFAPTTSENTTPQATEQAAPSKEATAEKTPSDAPAPSSTAAPTAQTASSDRATDKQETDAGAAPEKSIEPDEAPGAPLKVNFSLAEESAVIRMPFRERIDMAAFIRHGSLWIVLGKKIALNLKDYDKNAKTVIGQPELFKGETTILRIPVQDGLNVAIAKQDNSLEWAVLVNQAEKKPEKPLKLEVHTEPPVPPHVFVNSLQMGGVIAIKDPLVGDEMLVVPMFTAGEGIAIAREFVDFTLPQTAQGLLVVKKSDDVNVAPLRNGLRVTTAQGAQLTPGLPSMDISSEQATALKVVPTLFSYEKWALPPEIPERAFVRDLMKRIVESENTQAANDLRVRLAEIYLGSGLGAEALSMLDAINRTDPAFYKSNKLAALSGAANFLMARYTDAMRAFSASELNNNKEMDYWRKMLSDLTGREGTYDYLALNDDYISHYPPIFRQKLAIVAADRNIDAKEYNTAIRIFETLKTVKPNKEEGKGDKKDAKPAETSTVDASMLKDDLIAPIAPYVNYLMAKIAADTGQTEESIRAMDILAQDYKHPFVRSRAEFAKIIWEMNRDLINKTQVVERLERLRLAWHGDSLELKILDFLGEIYAENKDFLNAMRIWDNAVHAYAGTPRALELQRKLEDTFVMIFKEGIANSLPPLEALALYYQYKNYAPPGSIGREVISNLTDRLISVDLLDQAASLLEYQMRYDSEKSQRSQLGAKVATIHLLNHEPRKALRALQDSVYGENPVALHQIRNRLAAQSLVELGETERAWQVVANDDSPDAERIRLNILFERRDWPRVINTVETLLRSRKDITTPVNLDESEQVIKLALAYVFENNIEQLQYLRDYFTPLMANSPNKTLFEFITASDVTPTPTNFEDVLAQMQRTRSFIEKYRAQIQTAGLSSVVK